MVKRCGTGRLEAAEGRLVVWCVMMMAHIRPQPASSGRVAFYVLHLDETVAYEAHLDMTRQQSVYVFKCNLDYEQLYECGSGKFVLN